MKQGQIGHWWQEREKKVLLNLNVLYKIFINFPIFFFFISVQERKKDCFFLSKFKVSKFLQNLFLSFDFKQNRKASTGKK